MECVCWICKHAAVPCYWEFDMTDCDTWSQLDFLTNNNYLDSMGHAFCFGRTVATSDGALHILVVPSDNLKMILWSVQVCTVIFMEKIYRFIQLSSRIISLKKELCANEQRWQNAGCILQWLAECIRWVTTIKNKVAVLTDGFFTFFATDFKTHLVWIMISSAAGYQGCLVVLSALVSWTIRKKQCLQWTYWSLNMKYLSPHK